MSKITMTQTQRCTLDCSVCGQNIRLSRQLTGVEVSPSSAWGRVLTEAGFCPCCLQPLDAPERRWPDYLRYWDEYKAQRYRDALEAQTVACNAGSALPFDW